jgi:cytochrome c5
MEGVIIAARFMVGGFSFGMFLEKVMKLIKLFLAATILASGVAFAADSHDQALVERIKAVGEVCTAGANCAADTKSAGGAAAPAAARSGADIVAKQCSMCHGPNPMAPKTAADWVARSKADGGIDGLVASATKGKNAMPPKGMCMDCTPEELKAAITELSKGR